MRVFFIGHSEPNCRTASEQLICEESTAVLVEEEKNKVDSILSKPQKENGGFDEEAIKKGSATPQNDRLKHPHPYPVSARQGASAPRQGCVLRFFFGHSEPNCRTESEQLICEESTAVLIRWGKYKVDSSATPQNDPYGAKQKRLPFSGKRFRLSE